MKKRIEAFLNLNLSRDGIDIVSLQPAITINEQTFQVQNGKTMKFRYRNVPATWDILWKT